MNVSVSSSRRCNDSLIEVKLQYLLLLPFIKSTSHLLVNLKVFLRVDVVEADFIWWL